MARDRLTQAEVDALLGPAEARTARVAIPSAADSTAGAHHAVRIDQEQLDLLDAIHERFARQLGVALSGMLRNVVDVRLTSLDQLTYGEFILRLENPTCFNVVTARSIAGSAVLELASSIVFPLLDRLLGGGREPAIVVRRPLTEIELRLVARVTSLMLEELRRAWQPEAAIELAVERVESNPQTVRAAASHDAVVLVRFEIAMNDARGRMHLCITESWLQQVLAAKQESPAADQGVAPQPTVELVAQLAETRITTDDLASLDVGDVITTDQEVGDPIAICVQGRPKFRARPGAFKGHKAIEIKQAVDERAGD